MSLTSSHPSTCPPPRTTARESLATPDVVKRLWKGNHGSGREARVGLSTESVGLLPLKKYSVKPTRTSNTSFGQRYHDSTGQFQNEEATAGRRDT